jgi:hypothetical protein
MTIDGYVFISNGSDEDTEGIVGKPPEGRWSGRAVGAFDGVVAIEARDMAELHARVRGIRNRRGPIRTDTLVAVRPRNPCPVKRTSLPDGWVMAFTLIDARAGQTTDVLEAVRSKRGVTAAAIVTGSADVLVELMMPTFEDLLEAVEGLGSITGIRSQRTTFIEPA